jgi:hypothetical protein
MGTIYLPVDQGDAMLYNNNAYEKVGNKYQAVNGDETNVQYADIPGYTYNNGDARGKNVYTPGEEALSIYEYGCRGTPFQHGPGGYHNAFTVCIAGVLRIWGGQFDRWYINGILQTGSPNSKADAEARDVSPGDVVAVDEVGSTALVIVYWGILPFTHIDGVAGPVCPREPDFG